MHYLREVLNYLGIEIATEKTVIDEKIEYMTELTLYDKSMYFGFGATEKLSIVKAVAALPQEYRDYF